MKSALQHRPTAIGLFAFVALVVVTAVTMTYRLTASESSFAPLSGGTSHAGPPAQSPSDGTHESQPPAPNQPTVSITGVGDIVMGSTRLGLPPNNGAGFFDDVKSELDGDLVTGNFEGTLTEATGHDKCAKENKDAEPKEDCYAYRVPPSYAQHVADAGFDVLSLANNHTNDYGDLGLRNTQKELKSVGVDYTGMPRQYVVRQVGEVKVAVLGFGPYGWQQKVTEISKAKRLVEQAATEADVVVVHMQAGGEGTAYRHVKRGEENYLGENRGDVIAFSHAVVDAGADLVIGHGPHVMRGMEWYDGRLIAYSLGSFAGYKASSREGANGVGAIMKITLRKDGSFDSGQVVPTKLAAPGLPALDPKGQAIADVNELSEADFPKSQAVIAKGGAISAP
ncbi:MAG: CapA family protein [Corynebacteriales bacterium]|nr:CapA family protein [Mycobacteriales bacterium]